MSKFFNSEGFTLIELIGAVSIITILLVFVMSVFPTSLAASKQAEYIQIAASIGNELMQDYLNREFDEIVNDKGTKEHKSIYNNIEMTTLYNYQLTVTSPGPDLKNLSLTVSWTDRNKKRDLIIETIVYRKD